MVTKYLAVLALVAMVILIAPASAVGQCGEQGCGKISKANCLPTQRCVDQGFWKGYNCVADPTCVAVTTTPTGGTSCTDTDAGDVGNIKGTCTPATGKYCVDSSIAGASCTDYCIGGSSVREYFCTSGAGAGCGYSDISCPSGYACSGGACVSVTPTPSCPLCHTSGTPTPTPAKAGCTTPTSTNIFSKETCTDSTGAHPDACVVEGATEGTINQFYCDAGQCKKITDSCAAGYKCDGGKCVALYPKATPTPVSTAAPSCSETDAGFDYPVKGACTDAGPSAICPAGCADKCTTGSELNEYYCYAKRCYLKPYSCPSTQKCVDGACVPLSATPTPNKTVTPIINAVLNATECKAAGGTCKRSCSFSESDKGRLGCGGGTGYSQYATKCCVGKFVAPKPTAVPARTPFGKQSVPVVGTECKTSEKGTCKSKCALTENDKGASDCGEKKSCCVKKTKCNDETPFNTCNAKGEWCNMRGVLVYGGTHQCKPYAKSTCPNQHCETGLGGETYLTCPQDCPKPGVVQSTQSKCSDGTTKFSCSAATPGQYCNGVGQLVPFVRCQMLPA